MTRSAEILPHTLEALRRDLRELLSVEQGEDETRDQWITGRVNNIAFAITGNYCGYCYRCRRNGHSDAGAMPLREASDITAELRITTERKE